MSDIEAELMDGSRITTGSMLKVGGVTISAKGIFIDDNVHVTEAAREFLDALTFMGIRVEGRHDA